MPWLVELPSSLPTDSAQLKNATKSLSLSMVRSKKKADSNNSKILEAIFQTWYLERKNENYMFIHFNKL